MAENEIEPRPEASLDIPRPPEAPSVELQALLSAFRSAIDTRWSLEVRRNDLLRKIDVNESLMLIAHLRSTSADAVSALSLERASLQHRLSFVDSKLPGAITVQSALRIDLLSAVINKQGKP